VKSSRFPQQLVPLSILFGLAIAGLIVIRAVFVPATFGEYGHYRAAAVGDIMKINEVYAGYKVCVECHSDIFDMKQQSPHKGLSCEVCHGAAAGHASAPDSTKPNVPTGRDLCTLCHGFNESRPSGFPQVIAIQHNPGRPCMACHNPHSPLAAGAVEECVACHAGIANQKAVSSHTTLACTRCHTVPKEHFTQPRAFQAQKPQAKEVCGSCHAKGAEAPAEIPRIDLATHGGRYICWDCHYPHYPEARQ